MEAAAACLKPGGHALVWSLPRTAHWTAMAVEDAGLEIRDCIPHLFGSGFPKSLDVSKSIDKRRFGAGAAAEFKEALAWAIEASGKTRQQINDECGFTMRFDIAYEKDPRGWGCSLPTVEQYVIIRDVLGITHDLGLEAARRAQYEVVGHDDRLNSPSGIVSVGRKAQRVRREITAPGTEDAARWDGWGTALKPGQEIWWLARKPIRGTVAANVLAHGTGALNIDGCRVDTTDKLGGGRLNGPTTVGDGWDRPWMHDQESRPDHAALTAEKVAHAEQAGRWPANVVFTHSASCAAACAADCPVAELDRQSGTSRFFPVFRYEAKAPAHERPKLPDGTAWPTVKPVDLMAWLVRLITPPGGVVLDLFAGTGTTGEACLVEGFRCVLIERDPVAVELIRTRLRKPVQPVMFGESA
jgi:hypothetical protein